VWLPRGTFTVGATVTANSITPSNGSGTAQGFTLSFSDPEGVTADLKAARVSFQPASGVGPVCIVDYDAMTNMVRIQRDDASWTNYRVLGSAVPSLTNSQCSLNVAASGASRIGSDLTLTLNLTFFTPGFSGAKTVSLRANSNVGSTSGWVKLGDWAVP
jgi:hypothetical protein